jgi:chromosomal replication initiation ATPase DnaA
LDKLKDGILQGEEISNRKQLQAAYESDDVIEAISTYFNVSPDDVFKKRSEYRNIAIYLMKKFTGMTNRQIGQLFGDLSYSAVARHTRGYPRNYKRTGP